MSKGSRDADMLYDYLVSGNSQQTIADDFNMTQPEVSDLFRNRYGLNKGNVKWGKGSNNYSGKYSDLSYDDICAFVDSGSRDFDSWYSDLDDYEEDDEVPVESFKTYDGPSKPVSRKVSVPVSNSSPRPRPNNYNNRRNTSSGDVWGNIAAIGLLALICFIFWLIEGFSTNNMGLIDCFKFLFEYGYFWASFAFGVIYGVIRGFMSRDIKGLFTSTPLYAWTGLGFVLSGIKCYFDYSIFMPCIVLCVIGIVIWVVSYKLFGMEG